MNTLQKIESIQQVFPNVSRNQIRLDLDTAQKIFATETKELKTRASLSSISTNFAWTLPTGFLSLDDITLYDSNNNPKYLEDFNYKYEIELGKLFIYSLTSIPITGLDSGIASAYIHYKELPETLTAESTSLEISEQFRDAIESYVLSKYFGKFPVDFISGGQIVKAINLQLAQWHESRYEKLRLKIKKYLGSQIKTSGEGQFYQHAGSQILPRRPNDGTSSSIVQIAGLSDIYDKYAYFKITGTGDIVPTITIGYTTIACTVVGNTITLSSTGEFDPETFVFPSNLDATWTRDSSSQYTITIPSGWTVFAFEIYERD